MKLLKKQIILFRISLVASLTGILILATIPLDYPIVSGINDKFSHLLAFFMLALLTDFSFPGYKFNWYKIIPLMGYGMLIEVIQYFLPHRMFSLFDVSANAFGMVVYYFCIPVLKHVPVLRDKWNK